MPFDDISIQCGDTIARVLPTRGALVSSLQVKGKELFYIDQTTVEDPSQNVRGGIPILFPFAGRLAGDLFEPAGTEIPQHGFARNKRWRMADWGKDFLRVTLDRDEEIRNIFPYRFSLEQTFLALDHGLQIDLMIMNMGESDLPIAPGWHPYFACPVDKKKQISSDLPELRTEEFRDERETQFALVPPLTGRTEFTIPGLGAVTLTFSPQMRHLQFWSQPGKDFLCIEPLTGPPNAINVPSQRLEIPPHSAYHLFMRVELAPKEEEEFETLSDFDTSEEPSPDDPENGPAKEQE